MAQSMGWENGARVPAYDPRDDEGAAPAPVRRDPVALVMARRLVGFMLADTHPALGIECLALVTGIGYQGASMAEIARRHGVTRAAVSKRCVELCEAFGVPPVRAMRPEKSREKCRLARVREMASL
jgi:protein-L-isoaspartate O-methyltransferase